jgi:hypothetical protein
MLIRLLTVLVCGLRVSLSVFVFSLCVMMRGLMVMVRGGLMGGRRIVMMLMRRVFGGLPHVENLL